MLSSFPWACASSWPTESIQRARREGKKLLITTLCIKHATSWIDEELNISIFLAETTFKKGISYHSDTSWNV